MIAAYLSAPSAETPRAREVRAALEAEGESWSARLDPAAARTIADMLRRATEESES